MTPEDIRQWNAASDDWHTTKATVDLRVGGAFSSRMEARDGSFGFDFAGTYTQVVPNNLIEYCFVPHEPGQGATRKWTAPELMYGGKLIAAGDTVFIFASENEGGQGLIARGVVTHAAAIPKKRAIVRQTPRVSVTIKRTALAKQPLGRATLCSSPRQ